MSAFYTWWLAEYQCGCTFVAKRREELPVECEECGKKRKLSRPVTPTFPRLGWQRFEPKFRSWVPPMSEPAKATCLDVLDSVKNPGSGGH
jgi:hypothetical protein